MRNPIAFSLAVCAVVLPVAVTVCAPCRADDSDIVPRGSGLLDNFALLARRGLLISGYQPANFVGEPLYTRGQLATLLLKSASWAKVSAGSDTAAAVRSAVRALEPELKQRGAKIADLLTNLSTVKRPSLFGQLDGNLRGTSGSGARNEISLLDYRAHLVGGIGRDGEYSATFSNWQNQWRRVYDSDVNRSGFDQLSEAYLSVRGRRGFVFEAGRLPTRWGAAYRGAAEIGDNAPVADGYRFSFPFSLGAHLGRNYRLTQFENTFMNNGKRIYSGGHRFEYAFNGRWSADFEEANETTYPPRLIPLLLVTRLPYKLNTDGFGPFKELFGKRTRDLDGEFNVIDTFSLTYRQNDRTRLYGQFLIDDYSSNRKKGGARKIGYITGAAFGSGKFDGILEFSYADDLTYTQKNKSLPWLRVDSGYYIGDPAGANHYELFARTSYAVSPKLLLYAQGRDRRRHSDHLFPVPKARSGEVGAVYRLDNRQAFHMAFRAYHQEPYPYQPGSPNYPVINTAVVANPPTPGFKANVRELEIGYQFAF